MSSFLLNNPSLSSRFFAQALTSGSLAHGYVLKGQGHAINKMYATALEVAKALNCEQPASSIEPCGVCTNCKWIASNSHPAVWTVSRLTFLVGDGGKELSLEDLEKLSKKPQQTQIKTDQIGRLVQQLGISSPYYRVVIFTDAEEAPAPSPVNATATEEDSHSAITATEKSVIPPYDWSGISGNEKKRFILKPLHRGLFNAESANRFLKTLEEPSPRTLFFFLTDSEDNLLETIVSRCQIVPFNSPEPISASAVYPPSATPLYEKWLGYFLSPQLRDVYPMIQEFQTTLVDGEGYSPEQALIGFQAYLREYYAANTTQNAASSPGEFATVLVSFKRYRQIQQALEQAIKLLQSKTNAEQTLQQLFWQLTTRLEPSAVFTGA
ncbi:MAG: hypothetical protein VKJ04_07750 [Vampirovibrionales bacterium]|nr:hypothetical protein [Vampirovibrionales bacterium]